MVATKAPPTGLQPGVDGTAIPLATPQRCSWDFPQTGQSQSRALKINQPSRLQQGGKVAGYFMDLVSHTDTYSFRWRQETCETATRHVTQSLISNLP